MGRLLATLVFTAACLALAWNAPAWDLTASYVAGRLVHEGQAAFLYSPGQSVEGSWANEAWGVAAALGGLPGRRVTTFVQTPLWAWAMAPAAGMADFTLFKRVFALFPALAMAGLVRLAARLWAPALAGWRWQAGLLAGVFISVPFLTSLSLGQTHVLFLYLSVLAVALCLRGRELSAGAVLAAAAFIKISPAWIALGWLAAGRRRAVAGFALAGALLCAATLALAGPRICLLFLQQLRIMGSGVLLTFNNDSLAAVLLGGALTARNAAEFTPVPAPGWIGPLCAALIAAVCLAAGRLDRRARRAGTPQWGAACVLVAATCFTPLAWNHYYIVLVMPVMLFLQAWRRRGGLAWLALVAAILLLDLPPLAFSGHAGRAIIALRSEFWAGMLALAGMVALGRTARPYGGVPAAAPHRPGIGQAAHVCGTPLRLAE